MTFTFYWVTLAFVAVMLSVRLLIFVLLREPRGDLFPSLIIALTVPMLASLDGVIAGFAATRRPIKRIQHLVLATTQFASGNYAQRVEVSRQDEIGQLEHHFNQMAEQLAESMAQRQALAEQNARLAERARLSRDLHDSVKQHLFAVAMQVGVALAQVERNSEAARNHLLEADTLLSQAQQDLTALIHELRPSVLQQKGLPMALREQTMDWGRQHGIAVELALSEERMAPLAVEEAFWRIAQEALSNVARHSQATKVEVCLDYTPEQVTLTISDNGRGFESANGRQTGIGLHSIRERMAAVGGTVTIQSRPGEGTCLMACCPLPQGSVGLPDGPRKAEP
jgi:NarL family two-component system sensor histidine kinase LiaS